MITTNEDRCTEAQINVLIKAGCSPDVVAHCVAVARKAAFVAGRVKQRLDLDVIRKGAVLHDIGRSRTQGIEHAVAGVEIARALGFPEAVLFVIERHIGAGITAREAVRLGLPDKDYRPLTPEEKIVSYADNLISGVREMQFPEALERFKDILGPDHEGVELFIQQHREIRGWMI